MNPVNHDRPNILVIDDEPESLSALLQMALGGQAEVTVRHPDEVESEDLAAAHLVLMDYRLDDWPERDGQPAARRIQSGLALAAVLREAANAQPGEADGHLTAFALHTGHLSDISNRIRPPHTGHVLARLNNLEWVFEKSDQDLYPRVVQLARAAQRLRGSWPVGPPASKARARKLLGLTGGAGWPELAWREVLECQPPIHELGGGRFGVLFLRWLLHRILPYPCFLWGAAWVAARLRMRVDDLDRLMASECELARDLERMKYRGILAGFAGDRWWRAALEDYAWELGGRSAGRIADFRDRLREKAGEDLEMVDVRDPVVCVDRDFQPHTISAPQHALRTRPEYWPAHADVAWMRADEVRKDPELMAIVLPLDDYRIDLDE